MSNSPPSDADSDGRAELALLVDDSDLVRGLLAKVLHNRGIAVVVAAGPDEALAHCPRATLLLTGLEMRGGSGLDWITVVRARQPTLPIVAISATPRLLDRAAGAGADAVLAKPFALVDLDAALDAARVERAKAARR